MCGDEYYFEEGCYIIELHTTADDPALSMARARVEPGQTTRWHSLKDIEERYLILEGCGQVEIGEEAPREVRTSDTVVIPAGCRQRITNIGSADLVFLAVCTPRFRIESYRDLDENS
jgi:mannose-6-phosphate isomerase-like protein (cupin superfamily)